MFVIDHGERIDADQFEQLGRLIDRAPALRVAVATRSASTARQVATASDASVDVISAADLRFTLEELRDAGVLEGDKARLELLRSSEGLAIAVRANTDDAVGRASGVRERLRRVLRNDLGTQSYTAALRMALLPRVDRQIMAAWGLPEHLVDDLEGAGLTEWDGDWLRVPHFTREVLAEDAARELPTSERHRLIATAVRSSLIDRDPLQALREAFEIDDPALATEVVFASMVELLEARDETYKIFARVPASRLRGYPGLTVMRVLLSNMHPDTRPRALQMLASESLFQRLQPNRGLHRERVVYRAFEAAALRLTPLADSALPRIRHAVEDFSTLSEEDADALGRMGPMLQVHLGIGAFYLGELELARQCFDIADARHVEAARADRVDPLSMRAGLAALAGELPLARRLLAEADAAEWPEGWRDSSPADFFNLGMAVLALEDGDPDAADAHLAAAGPIADIIEHWTLYALVRARRDRLAGEAAAGLMRLQRLRARRRLAPGTAMARSLLDAAEAELRLAIGDANGARRVAARSAKHSAPCRIALARAELALGRVASAAMHAQQVLSASPTPRNSLDAELLLACCALRMGHRRDAEAVVMRVAEIIRSTGLRAPLRTVASSERGSLDELLLAQGFSQPIIDMVAADAPPGPTHAVRANTLTRRERAVLVALAKTGSLDEIAALLFVSRNTVKSQLRTVYRKLEVSSRDAALTRSAVLGLIDHQGD
ncbi:MAG: LuxR C-terminal-related transcriptional regulator [Microbacterium sp.]|nr:LuxR C-terminal-related transcriptional regulator [Microbacterium sp.]